MGSPTQQPATDESANRIGPIHINPGSGPVIDANPTDALDCIRHFVTDLDLPRLRYLREQAEDERGRFGFLLYQDTHGPVRRFTLIQMPGLPLHRVRYATGLDPWDFPRLYVDGSSWLWPFALSSALRALRGEEGGE